MKTDIERYWELVERLNHTKREYERIRLEIAKLIKIIRGYL